MAFRLTQGTFSFLPDLSDDEIRMQVQYCLDHDWPINVEFILAGAARETIARRVGQ